MAHHLFDVPEIMAIIARMCDRRDDVRCLRVNRAFHDAFVGRVWRVVHIDAFRMSRGPTVEAFERHKHWIQKLELLGSSNWTGSFGDTAYLTMRRWLLCKTMRRWLLGKRWRHRSLTYWLQPIANFIRWKYRAIGFPGHG
jgi:hypothetical protein